MNIINAVKAAPQMAVCHEKYLNSGRKFGAPATLKIKQAKLIKKYTSKKKFDIMALIVFKSPAKKPSWAKTYDNTRATLGSSPLGDP